MIIPANALSYDLSFDPCSVKEAGDPIVRFDEEEDDYVNIPEEVLNDCVDERDTIQVLFDYPMEATTFDLTRQGGWTLSQLLWAIAAKYQEIYAEEDAAPEDAKPYGIWGHDLSDLTIDTLYRDADGVWQMEVSS